MGYDSQSRKEVRDVAASFRLLLKDKLEHMVGQIVKEARISGGKHEHLLEYLPGYVSEIVTELIEEQQVKKGRSA